MIAGGLREGLAALAPLAAVPYVSVVLAVRDEELHIARTLDAVRGQDWPAARIEILVVDGSSADRTREIVGRIAARDARVRLLENPRRIASCGLNEGLRAARGEVIVRVDGHCRVPPGYVRAAVEELRSGRAECAGGPVRALGGTPVARAIALAMSSPFGVGGASFRWARDSREVEHLPFGAWRREVFAHIGGFDEALVRNQDDELSDRLRRAGGRIRLLAGQCVDYWSRASLGGLWRQYLGYGYWKVRVIRRRGGLPSSPRHLAPAALLVGALAGGVLGLGLHAPAFALAVPLAYAAFVATAMLVTLGPRGEGAALLLPIVLPVMHAAYGAGFLAALLTSGGAAAADTALPWPIPACAPGAAGPATGIAEAA